MSMEPVRVGVIGYGHYFRTNFIRRLRKSPKVKILGVYNRGEMRRRQAEEAGFFATGDLDELLALPGLEVVIIGTSNSAHKELSVKAARAGKHVVCDKPLALSPEDVDEMAAAVRDAGVLSHVKHPGPYMSRFVTFRRLVREHCEIILHLWIRSSRTFGLWSHGARHEAVEHPEASGGWTFHHLCHHVHSACVILEDQALRVFHVEQKSAADAPSEEITTSILQFRKGATALLTDTTALTHMHGDMGVIGTKAEVRALDDTVTLLVPGPTDPTGRPGNLTSVSHVYHCSDAEEDDAHMLACLLHDALRGGENRLTSFESVRHEYRIMAAMKESARTGSVTEVGPV